MMPYLKEFHPGLMPYLKVLFQNQSIQFLPRRPWVDALPKGSVSKSINTVGQGDPGLMPYLKVLFQNQSKDKETQCLT